MPKLHKPQLIHLDTNRINARQSDEDLNKLEEYHRRGLITLEFSRAAYVEAKKGSGVRSKKAEEYTWARAVGGIKQSLEKILFPAGCVNENQKNDVEVALAAQQTKALLVTADTDFLSKAEQLAKRGLRVVTAKEALQIVELQLEMED